MSRDSSGTYTRVVTPPVNGDVASATNFNSEINDFASEITASLEASGKKTWTGNQNASSYGIKTLANTKVHATAGGTTTYTVTTGAAFTAYTQLPVIFVKANATNTGSMTINVDSIGALTCKKNGATNFAASDFVATYVYAFAYDGTDLQLIGGSLATGYQPLDSDLTAIAALTSAADKVPYSTGAGTWAMADFSSTMRTFLTTPSSANLASLVSDETGSGALVFGTSPTIATPSLTGAVAMSSGGSFNFSAGDVTITHSANTLTFAGASSGYAFDAAISNSAGNITSSAGDVVGKSLTISGSGGVGAGSIYSDANWGMLYTAKQASPATAEFSWRNSAFAELMRLTTANVLTVNGVTVLTTASGAQLAAVNAFTARQDFNTAYVAFQSAAADKGQIGVNQSLCGTAADGLTVRGEGELTFSNNGTRSASLNSIAFEVFVGDTRILAAPTALATNSAGFRGAPQQTGLATASYTLVLGDAGGHVYHTSASAHTLTIPANASVAYPIGTVIVGVNATGAGVLTVAITTDTLQRGDGTSGTGSRTIAANSMITLLKVSATVWYIDGSGMT